MKPQNNENKYFCKKNFIDASIWSKNQILYKKGKFYELAFYIDNNKKFFSRKIPVELAEGVAITCEKYTDDGQPIHTNNVGFYFDNPSESKHMFSDYFLTNQQLRKLKLQQINK